MRRTAQLVAVLTTFVIGLAGCASGFPDDVAGGEATDDGGGALVPEDTPTGQARTETEQAESGTAALQPCELLTAEDLTALDLPTTEKEARNLGPARGCQWQKPHSDEPGHTVTLGIMDELSIDEVVSDTDPKPLTVGSHEAMRYTAGGSCGIAMAVTESSRVDVLGTSDGDLKRGCKVAKRAAKLVEQHLP